MKLAVLVLLGLAILPGCGDSTPSGSDTPTPIATETAASPTPSPAVQEVIDAVQRGDIEALVALIQWVPTMCGSPHGATDYCPEGTQQGTELPMVYAGFADTFLVAEATLREGLEQVLGDRTLDMTYLTESLGMQQRDGTAGDFVFVGLEGDPVPVGAHVFWGDAGQKTGVFLQLDPDSARPIVEIGFLSETWTAEQQGSVFADQPQAKAVCAADSTQQFNDIQDEAPFAVYCPTLLPAGFAMERISFNRPEGGSYESGSLVASFVQPTSDARITFHQGNLGNAVFPGWVQYGPPPKLGTIPYGSDAVATLYDERMIPGQADRGAVVWGESADG